MVSLRGKRTLPSARPSSVRSTPNSDSASAWSSTVKLASRPTAAAWRRSSRLAMEWNVPPHTRPVERSVISEPARRTISAAARRVKVSKQDPFGRRPLVDEPGHPAGQRAGLAAPRPGDDQQRPGPVGDGSRLLGVQVVQPGGSVDIRSEHMFDSRPNYPSLCAIPRTAPFAWTPPPSRRGARGPAARLSRGAAALPPA